VTRKGSIEGRPLLLFELVVVLDQCNRVFVVDFIPSPSPHFLHAGCASQYILMEPLEIIVDNLRF